MEIPFCLLMTEAFALSHVIDQAVKSAPKKTASPITPAGRRFAA
ncbi:hypothetical protein [Pseudomonas syringae]|nr:hypothetical protein [Pseudomonas syringae]